MANETQKQLPKDGWGVAPALINEPVDHYYVDGVAVAQIVPHHGGYQPYTISGAHHLFLGSGRVTLGPAVNTFEEAQAVVETWIEEYKAQKEQEAAAKKCSPATTKRTNPKPPPPPTEPVDSDKKK